tara:strand:+ start:301 stop:675 length:375 start_codon:yes stop_codon:yes gene_type:complete
MNKKIYSKKDLQEFKDLILSLKDEVSKGIEEARSRAEDIISEGNQSSIYSSHMADAGSDQQSLEHAYSVINRESTFLNYLDKALQRIEDGTYGACNDCNQLISKERLNEVPHATKCFDCKTSVV